MLALVLAASGCATALIVIFLPGLFRLFPRQASPARELPPNFIAKMRWCLAEAIALDGAVLAYQGAPLAWTIPFYATGAVLLIVFAPWFERDRPQSPK